MRKSVRMVVTLGLLLAIEIVLSRIWAVRLWNATYSFGFLAVALAAYLYGPLGGMLVAGLGDFIGAILIPIGDYFFGFTLTAIATGLVYGLLLYHKRYSVIKVVIAVVIAQIFFSQLVNTYWITLIYTNGKTYFEIFLTRVMQTGLYIMVQPVLIPLIISACDRVMRKTRYEGEVL